MDRPLNIAVLGGPDANALAAHLGDAKTIGTMPQPRPPYDWRADLEAQSATLRGLAAISFDVLVAEQCTVAMATLPRLDDDVHVLWLDAHGDLNTPETSASQYFGGMPLAAAVGAWDPGLGLGTLDSARVVMTGLRDLDPGEVELLAREPIRVAEPADAAAAVAGRRLFVHLDVDVLSNDVLPAAFPAAGGLTAEELSGVLAGVRASCAELVGVEVTAFDPPPDRREELAETVAGCIAHLLEDTRVG